MQPTLPCLSFVEVFITRRFLCFSQCAWPMLFDFVYCMCMCVRDIDSGPELNRIGPLECRGLYVWAYSNMSWTKLSWTRTLKSCWYFYWVFFLCYALFPMQKINTPQSSHHESAVSLSCLVSQKPPFLAKPPFVDAWILIFPAVFYTGSLSKTFCYCLTCLCLNLDGAANEDVYSETLGCQLLIAPIFYHILVLCLPPGFNVISPRPGFNDLLLSPTPGFEANSFSLPLCSNREFVFPPSFADSIVFVMNPLTAQWF